MAADVVVDASVVAALVFAEARASEATRAMGSGRLFAPSLVRYELASVCLKKISARPGERRRLLAALELSERLDIREVDVPRTGMVSLATSTGLTVYDAAYLWLARELGTELVTLDDTLAEAARTLQ